MENKDITRKLIGKEVTIITKNIYDSELISTKGNISYINPNGQIQLKTSECSNEGTPFAGFEEAIFQIKNSQNKIIYQNDSVIEKYQNEQLVEKEEFLKIQENGQFFLE